MAMTNAERQARWRKRHYVTAKAEGDGDFVLFALAFSTVLAALDEALKTPGRKEELGNEVAGKVYLLETLVKRWPGTSHAQRQHLAKARNVTQMFAWGACKGTRQAYAEMVQRKVAANPNWGA